MRRSFCPLSAGSVAHNATTAQRLNGHPRQPGPLTVAYANLHAHLVTQGGNVRATVQSQIMSITGGGNMALGAKVWLAVLSQAPPNPADQIFAFLLNCAATGPGYTTMGRLIHEMTDVHAKAMLGYLFRGHLNAINTNDALGANWTAPKLHGNQYQETAEFVPAANLVVAVSCLDFLKNTFVDLMVAANFADQAECDRAKAAFHAFPVMSTKGSQVLGSLIYTHWYLATATTAITSGNGQDLVDLVSSLQANRFQAGQGVRTSTYLVGNYPIPVITHLVYFPEVLTGYASVTNGMKLALCQFSVSAQLVHYEMYQAAKAGGRIQGNADVSSNIIQHCANGAAANDAGIALMGAVAVACFTGNAHAGQGAGVPAQGDMPHAFCRYYMTNDKAGAVAVARIGTFLQNNNQAACGGH